MDEKTSIQARERIHENRPTAPTKPLHVAARYHRRGALHLFAALSVFDGLVYGCCRETKKFVDFQSFLMEILIPEAMHRRVRHIYLILDNGSTHAPKQLQAWLNQKQQQENWNFTVQAVWLPTYASWLDQIEIWFSILQRKLLTPNHFPSIETLQERLLEFIAHYNLSAKPIEWSYTVAQMKEKFALVFMKSCTKSIHFSHVIHKNSDFFRHRLHRSSFYFFTAYYMALLQSDPQRRFFPCTVRH